MDTRSIKFTSVFIATIAIMLFSQGDLAYADDIPCENETKTGNISDNLIVNGICELDGVTLTGNIIVKEDGVVIIYGASSITGTIDLQEEFSEVYFEGTSEINTLNGNILGLKESSFVYIEAINMEGYVFRVLGKVHILKTLFFLRSRRIFYDSR